MKLSRRLIAISITISLVGIFAGCAGSMNTKSGETTTIVLTRHAERTFLTKVLTEEGHARARDLVKAAGDMKITAIYSPDLIRNLETVRPLAKHLGVTITVVDKKPVAREVVNMMLKNHPGEVVLWVGNTTNLADIYIVLGGDGDAPDNYGDIFTMKITDQGEPEIIKDSYGAPSQL